MKKLVSILVTLVFLMTLIPVMPTFAAASTVYTEDFEDISGWASNGIVTGSNLFGSWQGNGTLSSAADTYGNAVKFSNPGTDLINSSATLKTFAALNQTTDTTLVYTTRIKFVGTPDSSFSTYINYRNGYNGYSFYVGVNNDKYTIANSKGTISSGVAINADEWYTVITKISYSGTIHTSVYDSDGVFVREREFTDTTHSANLTRTLAWVVGNLSSNYVLLDNAAIHCVAGTDTFGIVASDSTAADTEIATDGTITLKFDQPITPTVSMFSVKDSSGTAVSGKIKSVAVKDFNTAIVKLTGLSNGEEYSLDFSGVTSAAGTALTGTSTLAFQTPAKELYVDDFNGTFSIYKFNDTSEIFTGGPENGSYSAGTADYEGGTYAIKLGKGSNTNSQLVTRTFDTFGLNDDSALIFTVKFKVEGTSETDVTWSINPNSGTYALGNIVGGKDGKYTVDGDAENSSLTAGNWYNMSIALYTTGKNEMIINDASTGEMIRYKSATVPANMATRPLIINTSSMAEGHSLTFADAKMYYINADTKFNFVAADSSAAGTEIAATGSVTLAFDKPVFGRMIKDNSPVLNNITVSGGAAVSDIKVVDFNKMIVSFDGLDYLADYTLNYSGIKLVGGTLDSSAPGILAFKTGTDPDNELTMKGDAVCSSAREGGTITLDLYSRNGINPTIIAAFYSGTTLEGVEIFANAKAIAAGATETVTVTLTNNHESANSIKLFAWDGISTMVPLMAEKAVAFP